MTETPTAPDVLHQILDQSRSGPDLPAVQDLDRHLNYAELVDEVAQVAAGLAKNGVAEGDRVALLLPNSVDFVVAALASLWIGAVFVPLAVTDPPTRLSSILKDCAPKMVIKSDSLEDGASPLPPDALATSSLSALRAEGSARLVPMPPGERGVYMIYTSGTTGTPKGVRIGSSALRAAVASTSAAVGLNRATRTLCISPFHFDGSYANLFPTLYAGGAVVIRPRESLLFPRTFFNAVRSEGITYSGFTPSYLRLLLASPQMDELAVSPLKIIALGGESIAVSDLQTLWSHAPELRVFNRYGPTETTIAVTNVELTRQVFTEGTVPIGRPHPGVTFYLVDVDGGVIVEPNHVGELYVGGEQLMDGYWGDPSLSAEVLRKDVVPGETLYRTGDLLYRDERGDFVYVDRADRVIKRSGVRISLVELNQTISALPGVDAAACLTFDMEGGVGIVAFVVTGQEISALELRRATGELLPATMLPDRFEFVNEFPLNKSNKLDERRLLSMAALVPLRSAVELSP